MGADTLLGSSLGQSTGKLRKMPQNETERGLVTFSYRSPFPRVDGDLALANGLADILEGLPVGLQMRMVIQFKPGVPPSCWMLVSGLTEPELPLLVAGFEQVGADPHLCPPPALNSCTAGAAVIRVRENGSVTWPGMIHELGRWMIVRGHGGYLVLDYKHLAAPGLARYDLALVVGNSAPLVAECQTTVEEVLAVDTSLYRQKKAAKFLEYLRAWKTVSNPRLDASVGNVADLLPV